MLASGSCPTLITTQPWMTGPHADAVKASIQKHDPHAERTIIEATTELSTIKDAEDMSS